MLVDVTPTRFMEEQCVKGLVGAEGNAEGTKGAMKAERNIGGTKHVKKQTKGELSHS